MAAGRRWILSSTTSRARGRRQQSNFKLGTNRNTGPGGPAIRRTPAGMQVQTDFDVPRLSSAAQTAIIGDPRNDENLIVTQFHHAMLCFHNQVVDLLLLASFSGDIFVEAKKIVTHHYQWAVANGSQRVRFRRLWPTHLRRSTPP